jgi:hypothetical protein
MCARASGVLRDRRRVEWLVTCSSSGRAGEVERVTDLKHVTYCGLYCGLCLNGCRIPRRAAELQDLLHKVRIEEWGPDLPGYDGFRVFLNELAGFEPRASCRARSCGPETCAIRTCAEEKGVDACPFCSDYPCERILTLAKRYVMLIGDGERMRAVGLEAWIEKQEARKARGFAYVDVRYDAAP